MAFVAELYNGEHDETRVELRAVEDPFALLLEGETPPDLIVSRTLGGPVAAERFRSLNDVVEGGGGAGRFYGALLETGRFDDEHIFLPLSFDGPGIMYRRPSAPRSIPAFSMDNDTLRSIATGFNRRSGNTVLALGFMPRQDPRFLVAYARSGGTNFAASQTLRWDPVALNTAINDMRSWIDEENGGVAAEEAFESRYLNDPVPRLFEDRRILFSFTTFAEFYGNGGRDDLEFRWYMNDHDIHMWGSPVLAAVPHGSGRNAFAFLAWLSSEEAQEGIIFASEGVHIDSFGFLGGLSSLPAVNEQSLVSSYDELVGMIPSAHRWRFGDALPAGWEDLRDSTIVPTLRRFFFESPNDIDARLTAEVDQWFRERSR